MVANIRSRYVSISTNFSYLLFNSCKISFKEREWCKDGAKLCLIHLANWQINRRKLCTIILSMNNDCEFVSARFFWTNSSTFLNSKIKQRWLTHIIVIKIVNTRYKILQCRKQKIYLNFNAFCMIGNNWIA